jgi:hypothetical protein
MLFGGHFRRKQTRVGAFFRGHRISQMKEADNNQVDLLLRSLAGRRGNVSIPGEVASGGEQQVASDHLDADELNSYAEGVAPEASRARYTQHLADCDSCRGIVVGLTQASGAANRYELPEQPRGLTFWQKLGALFAQPVWRYAVPAMVLTTVIGIGLFAVLRQRRNDFVAQNGPVINTPSAGKVDTVQAPPATNGQPAKTDNGIQSATPPVETTKGLLQGEKIQPAGHEEVAPGANVPKAEPEKDGEVTRGVTATTESRPADAIESKAGASASRPAPVVGYDKSAELAKEQPSKREDQDSNRDERFQVQAQNDQVHGPNRSRNNTYPTPNQQNADVASRRGGPSNSDKKQKANEVETRSVMGRRFMRDGGAWVDTDYESSRATIRVARGSDQYRALVADEPAIRTIAAELDGVVIVVWKNRAYRIQ